MAQPQKPAYLSTDPNWGSAPPASPTPAAPGGYLSTDPNWGQAIGATPVVVDGAAPSGWAASRAHQARGAVDLVKGAVKGALSTGSNLGYLAARTGFIPGVTKEQAEARLATDRKALEAHGTAQKAGKAAEQIGEFFIPGAKAEEAATWITTKLAPHLANAPAAVKSLLSLLPKMATQGVAAGAVTAAQGGSLTTGGAIGATAPVAGGAIGAAGRKVGELAVPLVRAAIKPTVTAMKQTAGASTTGINAVAERLAKFILDHRLTTPDKAEAMIKAAETELQAVLKNKNAVTDAPQRAVRYLGALERSAAKQGLPASDVAQIRGAARELLEQSPLSEDVITMAPKLSAILGPNGQPLTTLQPVTSRALRSDVMADEALEIGRAQGRWSNRKAYGELKGANQESSKAVERAARDASKEAVKETKPILRREGQAIQAKQVLDRMAFRQANRDAVSLPAHVIAAGELASGHVPVLSMGANWLRNNQMKAGIYANELAKAVKRGDKSKAAYFLRRLGVAVPAEATK